MQTFLPYPDVLASAAVLDDRRLGKQRVETFQVLRALTWPTYGWKNHPAVRMWRGFVPALVAYGLATVDEWAARGYADATRDALLAFTGGRVPEWDRLARRGQVPPWFGYDPVHVSHQSALVRKEPEYYRQFFPEVPDDLPYLWPTAAFPRWPVRRGGVDALPLPEALALLGLTEAWEPQREAVEAAVAGRDLTLALPPGGGATTAGLLAGLCTPGSTVWVVPRAASAAGGPGRFAVPASRRQAAREGKLSASIARVPSEVEAAAMAAEAAAEAEFAFLAADGVASGAAEGAGLVVVDAGVGPVPDVGLPVLRLVQVPVDRTDAVPADAGVPARGEAAVSSSGSPAGPGPR